MPPSKPPIPLDWVKGVQDWFSKTEKSSGFRPILIALIIVCGFSIVLLCFFRDVKYASEVALLMPISVLAVFLLLHLILPFLNPDFFRSEKHLEKIKRLELESMGSDAKELPGLIIESENLTMSIPDDKLLKGK